MSGALQVNEKYMGLARAIMESEAAQFSGWCTAVAAAAPAFLREPIIRREALTTGTVGGHMVVNYSPALLEVGPAFASLSHFFPVIQPSCYSDPPNHLESKSRFGRCSMCVSANSAWKGRRTNPSEHSNDIDQSS